jgi:hypothetical protein
MVLTAAFVRPALVDTEIMDEYVPEEEDDEQIQQ